MECCTMLESWKSNQLFAFLCGIALIIAFIDNHIGSVFGAPADLPVNGFRKPHVHENLTNGILLYDGRTVAEISYDKDDKSIKHCRLYDLDDSRKTEMLRKRHANEIVKNTDFKTMLDIIVKCRDLEEIFSGDNSPLPTNLTQSSTWSLFEGIVPGTKWCGLGDIAKDYEDLGTRSNVDVCCRAHDHCPIRLKAFRTGFGLINLSIYTKSHCDCDEDFLRCLKQTKSRVSDLIGNFYFNVLKVQCIREEHPLKCVSRTKTNSMDVHSVCQRWEPDTTRTRMKIVTPLLIY